MGHIVGGRRFKQASVAPGPRDDTRRRLFAAKKPAAGMVAAPYAARHCQLATNTHVPKAGCFHSLSLQSLHGTTLGHVEEDGLALESHTKHVKGDLRGALWSRGRKKGKPLTARYFAAITHHTGRNLVDQRTVQGGVS